MQESLPTEQLSAYLDGELTDAEVSELEHRLLRDPALRTELDGLRAAVDLLRTHGPVSAPTDLYRTIVAAADKEPMPGGWWRWLQRPLGLPIQGVAVAAVAAVVLVVSVPLATMNMTGGSADEREVGALWDSSKAPSEQKQADNAEPTPAASSGYGDEAETIAKPVNKRAKEDLAAADQTAEPSKTALQRGESATAATTTSGAGTADDSASSAGSTSKETAKNLMYSGSTTFRVKVQPDELGALLRIAERYKGSLHRGGGNSPVTTAEDLTAGEHTFTVQLQDARARNGFAQELKRSFKGRVVEHAGSGDFLTIDGTRVTLELMVPEGQGGEMPPKSMQTVLPDDQADEIDMLNEPKLRSNRKGTPAN